MKKLLLSFLLLASAHLLHAQSCEEREASITASFRSFSAATLYNTYALIGSIGDGYAASQYDAGTVGLLLDAQIKMADNLVNVLEKMLKEKSLPAPGDAQYAKGLINLLKGLQQQARLLESYTLGRKNAQQNAYEKQRKQNWTDISQLMGITE